MAEMPEVGVPTTGTLESIFRNLLDHRELMYELPFPTIGGLVRLRVTPDAEGEYFDFALFCIGDEEHEGHLINGQELLTEDEVTELLMLVRQQEEVRQMIRAFSAAMN
jgi:hypothetical protein